MGLFQSNRYWTADSIESMGTFASTFFTVFSIFQNVFKCLTILFLENIEVQRNQSDFLKFYSFFKSFKKSWYLYRSSEGSSSTFWPKKMYFQKLSKKVPILTKRFLRDKIRNAFWY